MEKEVKILEEEFQEINKFDANLQEEEAVTFSSYCGGHLTIICC